MHFELLRPYLLMLTTSRVYPFLLCLFGFFFTLAFYCCTWVVPSDFQQGENYRIIYMHVPAAWISLIIYTCITITSVFFLITKHPLMHLFTQVGSKIGILFTALTLITGCFWGKPMWGTFWVWDARLTSVFILLCIYIGTLLFTKYASAEIASVFICIGLINIPIIKFSVNWWNTLHQPSSISQFGTSIHVSMLTPILLMFTSFILISILLLCLEIRRFILKSYTNSLVCSTKKSV